MRIESDSIQPSPLVTTSFDDPESITELVVQAVAAVDDTPIEALPALTTAVDPDALITLFSDGATGHVSFFYNDHKVVVTSPGEIKVY